MTSSTRQFPNKVLSARVTERKDLDSWPYEDFPGDLYWSGGTTPKPYRWELSVSINSQTHGDPSTREPFLYNGIDVFVGDWISDTTNGISLKIISIIEKNANNVLIVVEDVDRYNTFLSETADGLFGVPGNAIIFESNDANLPILNPLPSLNSVAFVQEVMGRFMNNNPLFRTRVFQESHGLNDNDSIWVDPADGLFKTITNDNELKRMVGTVDRAGPGQDVFYFIPTTKVIEGIDPPLPGTAGDLIYSDPFDGTLSTDPSERTKVAYIQLTDATSDVTTSTNNVVTTGSVLEINGINVTFTGTTMTDVVSNINLLDSQTGVSAALESGVNTTSTDSAQLAYGICACIGVSTVIEINGSSVSFNDDTNGQAEFGFSAVNAVDMSIAINASNIPDIVAVGTGSTSLTITNLSGGAINIVTTTPDDSGIPFAGNASCSGVPSVTAPGGIETITFTNVSGNGIIFANVTGTPVFDLGLTSVRNGMLPLGLVVEQFITTGTGVGGARVYSTLQELPPFGVVGDQAFVIDSNDGNGNKDNEWSMFLWDGFNWVKTSDEDSAGTDARSLDVTLTNNSASPLTIGTLSDERRVVSVIVEVTTPFNDISATLNIGDEDDAFSLMTDDLLDLSVAGSYSVSPGFVYQTGNDTDIIATVNSGSSTQGSAKVVITYV